MPVEPNLNRDPDQQVLLLLFGEYPATDTAYSLQVRLEVPVSELIRSSDSKHVNNQRFTSDYILYTLGP